jgi:predicted outer membrane lipoprotein
MITKEQIRKLTWKYFWQQKFTEICLFITIVVAAIVIPYLIGHHFTDQKSIFCGDNEILTKQFQCGYIGQWFLGLWYGGMTIACAFVIITILWYWIVINWEKAERRAEAEQ